MDSPYIAKATLQVCPYSGDAAIVKSFDSVANKSQCEYSAECSIEHCPLEEELKHY